MKLVKKSERNPNVVDFEMELSEPSEAGPGLCVQWMRAIGSDKMIEARRTQVRSAKQYDCLLASAKREGFEQC